MNANEPTGTGLIRSKHFFPSPVVPGVTEEIEAGLDALVASVPFDDPAWVGREVAAGRIPYFGPGECSADHLPADYLGLYVAEPEPGHAMLDLHWPNVVPDTYGPTKGMLLGAVTNLWKLPRGWRAHED